MLALPLAALAVKPGTVSILGDSYSTYKGAITPAWNVTWYHEPNNPKMTDVDSVGQTWWSLYIAEKGLQLEKNNSFSGSTVCTTGYRNEDYSDRAFITRMHDLGDPEKIFVFGATNDSWANSPIGEWKWENQTAEDLKSFRPAIAYLMSGLKRLYPEAEITYILNDGLKEEINESILEACKRNGVKVVLLKDIDKTSNHPNRRGMRQIADQLK